MEQAQPDIAAPAIEQAQASVIFENAMEMEAAAQAMVKTIHDSMLYKESRITELRQQVQTYQGELQRSTEKVTTLTAQLQNAPPALTADLESSRKQLSITKSNLDRSLQEINMLKDTNNSQKDHITSLSKTFDTAMTDRDEGIGSLGKYAKSREELSHVQKENHKLRGELEKASVSLMASQLEKMDLHLLLTKKDLEMQSELDTVNSELDDEIADKKRITDQYQRDVKQLIQETRSFAGLSEVLLGLGDSNFPKFANSILRLKDQYAPKALKEGVRHFLDTGVISKLEAAEKCIVRDRTLRYAEVDSEALATAPVCVASLLLARARRHIWSAPAPAKGGSSRKDNGGTSKGGTSGSRIEID